MTRREWIGGSVALPLMGATGLPGWAACQWKIDRRCILPRGGTGSFDARVVGDPCIVWDDEISAWRMFYFASPGLSAGEPERGRIAGMAVSRSAEEIGPGDWRKVGPARVANPFPELVRLNGHKLWIVMDANTPNRAARIDGRYWALFVLGANKHIYAARTPSLSEPWTVAPSPILSPDPTPGAVDGRHCDTPTAYWMPARGEVLIFYKAYPRDPQRDQPESPFGSRSVVAWWRPTEGVARKAKSILKPGRSEAEFVRGWVGGVQLLRDAKAGLWYALLNGSPTAPEDDSHREPAPSLGGWAACWGQDPDSRWRILASASPLFTPERLSEADREAGLGVNFWRHHLLVTGRQARIFFNSGPYGREQMYSAVPAGS